MSQQRIESAVRNGFAVSRMDNSSGNGDCGGGVDFRCNCGGGADGVRSLHRLAQ